MMHYKGSRKFVHINLTTEETETTSFHSFECIYSTIIIYSFIVYTLYDASSTFCSS